MWSDLAKVWQETFLAGWEAFKNGSIPIGAVIVDENMNIISRGRNRTKEGTVPNSRTAHAETECIRSLDIRRYPDVKKYTLYTSMEPCPMCMGTLVMGNLRKVRTAARDSWCGSLHYIQDDPYIASKQIDSVLVAGELQDVQLAEQSYFNLKRTNGGPDHVVEVFRKDSPQAVAAAEIMFKDKYLDKCVQNDVPYNEVYDYIVALVKEQ